MPRRQPVKSPLSAKAQRLDLFTVEQCWAEYHAQKEGWSGGKAGDYPPGSIGPEWHCPICDRDFASASGARKHMKAHKHPVIRTDWY